MRAGRGVEACEPAKLLEGGWAEALGDLGLLTKKADYEDEYRLRLRPLKLEPDAMYVSLSARVPRRAQVSATPCTLAPPSRPPVRTHPEDRCGDLLGGPHPSNRLLGDHLPGESLDHRRVDVARTHRVDSYVPRGIFGRRRAGEPDDAVLRRRVRQIRRPSQPFWAAIGAGLLFETSAVGYTPRAPMDRGSALRSRRCALSGPDAEDRPDRRSRQAARARAPKARPPRRSRRAFPRARTVAPPRALAGRRGARR
ncbi:hypothetical protein BH09MYX1_BH09MYX1_03930 [soil metagenome]